MGSLRLFVAFIWYRKSLVMKFSPMAAYVSSMRRSWLILNALAVVGIFAQLASAQYSPSHPTVVAMVDKGIAYLEKAEGPGGDFAEGGEILVGYTINKVKADPDHPVVKKSINKAVELARSLRGAERHDHKVTYNVAVACLLLCDSDPEKYRPEIEMIRDWYVGDATTTWWLHLYGCPSGRHIANSVCGARSVVDERSGRHSSG
jgi:hypothetical protein